MKRLVLSLLSLLPLIAGCSAPPPPGPADVVGTSPKFTITCRYAPIAIEAVASLAIENGKPVVKGPATTLPLDVPPGADMSKPSPHWSLTSENDAGPKHNVVFTHDESLDEFSIELPVGTANPHYGTVKSQSGDAEVMVFAWGENGKCYAGYVTITPKPKP